jgi:hypothetical protein
MPSSVTHRAARSPTAATKEEKAACAAWWPQATLHAMLLRRLLSLVAALVLVLASANARAYARALQPETALRACASLAVAVPGQSADVSASGTKKKCVAASMWTVWVLVNGKEQARDAFGRFLPRDGSELKPGGPFENRVGDVLRQSHTDVVPQIRLQAEDGTVTVLDYGSRGPNGRVKLTEAKGSETAPLTENQQIAIPQIQTTGGVVVGRGTEQFPSGTQIQPTPVRVVRPSTMERLERLRRQREESAQ